jgi:hypothetical protein
MTQTKVQKQQNDSAFMSRKSSNGSKEGKPKRTAYNPNLQAKSRETNSQVKDAQQKQGMRNNAKSPSQIPRLGQAK